MFRAEAHQSTNDDLAELVQELRKLKEEGKTRELKGCLEQKGFISKPIVILSFKNSRFLFDKSDLKRIASRIGEFWSLELVEGNRLGLILFSSFTEVFRCFEQIQGKPISGPNSVDYLQVSFVEASQYGNDLLKTAQDQRELVARQFLEDENTSKAQSELALSQKKQPSSNNQLPKLTCKYEISYFSEDAAKEFLLSKRIIGPKGSNMKKIIEECFEDRPFESDALKLRLRGKGSGFKEGPQNRECNEPLHLCISAKNQFFYERATKMIERLLVDVCSAFDIYVVKQGLVESQIGQSDAATIAVKVYRKESVNGHRPDLMYPLSGDNREPADLCQDKKNRGKRPQGVQQKQTGGNRNRRGQPRAAGTPAYYN